MIANATYFDWLRLRTVEVNVIADSQVSGDSMVEFEDGHTEWVPTSELTPMTS